MKNLLSIFFFLSMLFNGQSSAYGQVGIISTYQGIEDFVGIRLDNYSQKYALIMNSIYKITSTNDTIRICGGGTSYGEGGMATAARFMTPRDFVFDRSDNIYVADPAQGVVRKVNRTGVITTYAGNYTIGPGYSGDGGPATNAQIHCESVCLDKFGNIFIADATTSRIRKITSGGIISTFAGTGIAGFTGDGGPATSARINLMASSGIIISDTFGNIYFTDTITNRLRKIDTSGVITTYAGNGTTDTTGLRGPATSTGLNKPRNLAIDKYNQIYIAQFGNNVIYKIDTLRNMNVIAGNFSRSRLYADGMATAVSLDNPSTIAVDSLLNLYLFETFIGSRVLIGSHRCAPYANDSFGVFTEESSPWVNFYINTKSYVPHYSVKIYFGDGQSDTSNFTNSYLNKGLATFNHIYTSSGTYSIKAILYSGTTPIDSLSFSYKHRDLKSIHSNYYLDSNSNCNYDASDNFLNLAVLTEIDSNGVPIDTISSTSGIYKNTYSRTSDIYSFKLLSPPSGLRVSCPSSGIIHDTLNRSGSSTHYLEMGFECNTMSTHDLAIHSFIPVSGVRNQWGMIFVKNNHCTPQNGTITLRHDRRYKVRSSGGVALGVRPLPSAFTDSTITWDVAGLSIQNKVSTSIYYEIWRHPDSPIVFGNMMHSELSIAPFSGDIDTRNNHEIRDDMVSAGYDPNHIDVSPMGYIPSSTRLKYSLSFTNTGNDTAYNIHVIDTLSPYINLSSFRIVSTTAKMNVTYLEDGYFKVLRFDFPDINLLDSVHHPDDCTRGLIYEVDVLPDVAPGTKIHNRAGIYFDFNPVVITNTAENIIGFPVKISNLSDMDEVNIYPNPVEQELFIEHAPIDAHYSILNSIGCVVQDGKFDKSFMSISLEHLAKGMYLIKIDKTPIKKFIKN